MLLQRWNESIEQAWHTFQVSQIFLEEGMASLQEVKGNLRRMLFLFQVPYGAKIQKKIIHGKSKFPFFLLF